MDIEIRPGTLRHGEWPVVHAYIDYAGRHNVIVDALHVNQGQTISRQLAYYTFPDPEPSCECECHTLPDTVGTCICGRPAGVDQ